MRLASVLATLSSLSLLHASPLTTYSAPANPTDQLSHGARNSTKSYCPSRPADPAYQHKIFNDFVNVLYGQRNPTKAFNTYVDVNLVEHDPFDGQGRDAVRTILEGIIPYATFEVLRINFDNNLGLIHVKIVDQDPQPLALADIYRMDGTCIVEHWDVVQRRPANATNPIAMF